MADDVRVRLWETGGRWYAHILDAPAFIEVTGTSRERCIAELRKVTGDDATLIVDVVPRIVGVAEAAEIMGWDKRRVVTYLDREQFPDAARPRSRPDASGSAKTSRRSRRTGASAILRVMRNASS